MADHDERDSVDQWLTVTDAPRSIHDEGEQLHAVRTALDRLREAKVLLQKEITDARAAGESWDRIARVLGVSRETAYRIYGHRIENYRA